MVMDPNAKAELIHNLRDCVSIFGFLFSLYVIFGLAYFFVGDKENGRKWSQLPKTVARWPFLLFPED